MWIQARNSAFESYCIQLSFTSKKIEIGQGVAKLQHREVTVIFSNVPKMGPKTVLMRMSSTLLFKNEHQHARATAPQDKTKTYAVIQIQVNQHHSNIITKDSIQQSLFQNDSFVFYVSCYALYMIWIRLESICENVGLLTVPI